MRVKVLVRVRPLLPEEQAAQHAATMLTLDEAAGRVGLVNRQGGQSNFEADFVCGPAVSQEQIFELGALGELATAVADGYNATVFAYGQTGSGKTYTMEGYEYKRATNGKAPMADFETAPARLGVVPRTVRTLFDAVAARNASAEPGAPRLRVMAHFVQIYKEQVLDLLNPTSSMTPGGGVGGAPATMQGLRLRWSPQREFFVDNLFVEELASADEALSLFQAGVRNKRVAETRMNSASSRSHCMLTFIVQQMAPDRAEEVLAEGRLTLVDLAGSERQQALVDAASKAAMAESVQINKSLFTLRKVILALSEASVAKPTAKKAFIPYRDSTLTRLLKHALGGNSHTLMVACISPSDLMADENASTLAYAARARAITNMVSINRDPHTQQVEGLKAEIAALKAEIRRLQQIIALSSGQLLDDQAIGGEFNTAASAALASLGAADAAVSSGGGRAGAAADGAQGQGGAREAELSAALEKESATGTALGKGLAQGVSLARSLAKTNAQLREAFDSLALQRDELEAANGMLMLENTSQKERLGLLELTLAMESYPTEHPSSLSARIEAQLRSAAQEVVALRNENASLKDRIATDAALLEAHGAAPNGLRPPGTAEYGGSLKPGTAGSRRGLAPPTPQARSGREKAGREKPSYGQGGGYGGGRAPRPIAAAVPEPPPPPPPPQAPLSLSSTGGLLLSSAWMPAAPAAASGGGSARQGSAGGQRTVPRLMPQASTFEELDQLSALLRKRAELSSGRPRTSAGRGQM